MGWAPVWGPLCALLIGWQAVVGWRALSDDDGVDL